MRSEPEATRGWLNDIEKNILRAESFVAGLDLEGFLKDDLRFYAVTRCLEIISEASRRLPDALKSRHPTITWGEIAAAGNIYRHEYGSVAELRVWNTLIACLFCESRFWRSWRQSQSWDRQSDHSQIYRMSRDSRDLQQAIQPSVNEPMSDNLQDFTVERKLADRPVIEAFK